MFKLESQPLTDLKESLYLLTTVHIKKDGSLAASIR